MAARFCNLRKSLLVPSFDATKCSSFLTGLEEWRGEISIGRGQIVNEAKQDQHTKETVDDRKGKSAYDVLKRVELTMDAMMEMTAQTLICSNSHP